MIVTIREEELVMQVENLSVQRLHRWIRLGLVRPERVEGLPVYHDVDVARVRLLRDLENAAEFDEDTVPLVLSLLDQIHGLRHELRALAAAVDQQPAEVRARVKALYQRFAEGA
jgi:chaperone modulatory protein CbpM